tara:strand:+ start:1868 stop:2167 length:300 start_codon:yes stop_codon:yes gene_type:complete
MRRKKAQPEMAVKCDYCGSTTDTFVATAEKLLFCRHQVPGQPAEKDCMEDYLNEKKEKEKRLLSQKKEQLQKEEILIDKNSAIKKLDELKQFLSKRTQK